jgi:hypothetical protein
MRLKRDPRWRWGEKMKPDKLDSHDQPADVLPLTTFEIMDAERLQWKAECLRHRSEREIREKAAAEVLTRELDRNNPSRNYQNIHLACFLAGLHGKSDYQKAWKWFKQRKIYGYYLDDGVHIELCVNDLRDKAKKTGRHG